MCIRDRRAGLTDVPTTLNQETMREKIIHERRMELAFEGHRWFDMIRVDNGNYALTFLKSIGKNNIIGKNPQMNPVSNSCQVMRSYTFFALLSSSFRA